VIEYVIFLNGLAQQ